MTHDNVTDIERRLQDVYGKLTPGAIETADLDGMAFTVADAITDLATLRKQLENAREALREIRDCTTEHGGAAKALRIINEALKGQQ